MEKLCSNNVELAMDKANMGAVYKSPWAWAILYLIILDSVAGEKRASLQITHRKIQFGNATILLERCFFRHALYAWPYLYAASTCSEVKQKSIIIVVIAFSIMAPALFKAAKPRTVVPLNCWLPRGFPQIRCVPFYQWVHAMQSTIIKDSSSKYTQFAFIYLYGLGKEYIYIYSYMANGVAKKASLAHMSSNNLAGEWVPLDRLLWRNRSDWHPYSRTFRVLQRVVELSVSCGGGTEYRTVTQS